MVKVETHIFVYYLLLYYALSDLKQVKCIVPIKLRLPTKENRWPSHQLTSLLKTKQSLKLVRVKEFSF